MRSIVILIALLALVGAGCATKKPDSADAYAQLAEENFRLGAYGQAVEHYRNLLDEYPFSEQSEEAELRIGIAHYKNNACPEATAAFTDFQRRHPTSASLPLVGYLLGRCAEEQMQPSDRDQSASQNAHSYYQALIQQHPNSPYAELARDRLQQARETLAVHEMQVAEYYLRHDNLKAAEIRLLDLVNRFNDTDVAGEALFELGEIYKASGQPEKALLAFAAVQYHHPDHDAAREAEDEITELAPDGDTPSGDPLEVLKAESGRSRTIAIAQSPARQTGKQQGRAPGPGPAAGTGFGLPQGGTGPFGRTGQYPGRY